jgi:membrane protease YdiL (CAAX protease family)
MNAWVKPCAKSVIYIVVSCICAFAMAGAAYLDMEMGLKINLFDISAKVIIMAGIFAYASLRGAPMNTPGSRFFTPWLLVALIPALANTVNTFCIPDYYPGTAEAINIVAIMLTTAAWEEMYFRYVGRTLFEKDGKYSSGAVVLLALTFGVPHLINIFFYDPAYVMIQVLSAAISGIFWLALYRHTGSLRLTIAGHFFQNFLGTFFQTFTTTESFETQTANRPGLIVMILCSIIQLAIGLYILKKYRYIAGQNKTFE